MPIAPKDYMPVANFGSRADYENFTFYENRYAFSNDANAMLVYLPKLSIVTSTGQIKTSQEEGLTTVGHLKNRLSRILNLTPESDAIVKSALSAHNNLTKLEFNELMNKFNSESQSATVNEQDIKTAAAATDTRQDKTIGEVDGSVSNAAKIEQLSAAPAARSNRDLGISNAGKTPAQMDKDIEQAKAQAQATIAPTVDTSEINDTSGIDPITGKPLDGSRTDTTQSSDSTKNADFLRERSKYLGKSSSGKVDPTLIFEQTSLMSIDRALGMAMYGLSNFKSPPNIPVNKDKKGYTFFTRPQLCLQDSNLANSRKFHPLLNDIPTSMQRQIRGLLDPIIMHGVRPIEISGESGLATSKAMMRKIGYNPDPLDCPFVDKLNPFIPILSNTLESMNGFPDMALNTFSSKPGMYRQSYVQFDDITRTLDNIDIECTFKNIQSDPITWLFYVWTNYGANVFEGTFMPYLKYIGENWIDYQTRIWRLVMDTDDIKVTKIAATGPAIPISMPLGAFFDFDNETPYNTQNKSLSVRFRCMGVETLDEILIHEFNLTMETFNSNMEEGKRQANYTLVPTTLKNVFSGLSYPYINKDTYHLEWWADNAVYTRILNQLKDSGMYGAIY